MSDDHDPVHDPVDDVDLDMEWVTIGGPSAWVLLAALLPVVLVTLAVVWLVSA